MTKLYFIHETEQARLYSRIAKSKRPTDADKIWIPKSVIVRTTKWPPGEKDGYPVHDVQVEPWFERKNDL